MPSSGFLTLLRSFRNHVMSGIRKVPNLGTGLALAGVLLWMVLTVTGLLNLAGADQIGAQIEAVVDREQGRELAYGFFAHYWLLLAKCLLPALLTGFVRLRRGALVLPVALACGWLCLWWLGGDLYRNLERALRDPLGMQSSPAAYFAKLGLMGFLILSVPLLMGLYFRATLMDRYMVRCFAVPFLLCVGAISGIMITMDLLNNANDFVIARFGFGKILLFYLAQLPQILVTITEASLLLACLYALGRMSRYNELVSMMSAGRSLTRIILPVLVFGGWCALAVMALNYQLAPQSERTKEEMLNAGRRAGLRDSKGVEFNVPYRNREDRRIWLIFRLPYDLSERNSMNEVWVMQQDEKGNPKQMIVAKRAAWHAVTRQWSFFQAAVVTFNGDLHGGDPVYYDKFRINEPWRETPGSILSDRLNPEYLGVPELLAYLKTNGSLPARSLSKYESALHWRFALPFRCFLLVLIAAPLGVVSSRRGLLGGVSTAVGLFIALFFLSAIMLKAGEGLYLPPLAGAWLVNAVFLAIGVGLLAFRSRNRTMPGWNPWRWFRHP